MQRQMQFDLPARPALGRGDFFVTESNAVAMAQVDAWPDWPGGKLVLVGPRGSGKTHLAHVWCTESAARLVKAATLAETDIAALGDLPICVEDVEQIAGQADAEQALFHLHNLVLANGQSLLVTAATPPSAWGLHLPDLASRMNGTTVARLSRPDDILLSAVLAKLFSDRQIVPQPDVIPYLVRHMPRSFADAGRIVDHLDRAALGKPKGVTRHLARKVLTELDVSGEDAAS